MQLVEDFLKKLLEKPLEGFLEEALRGNAVRNHGEISKPILGRIQQRFLEESRIAVPKEPTAVQVGLDYLEPGSETSQIYI